MKAQYLSYIDKGKFRLYLTILIISLIICEAVFKLALLNSRFRIIVFNHPTYLYHTQGVSYNLYCNEVEYLKYRPVKSNPFIETNSWGFRSPEIKTEKIKTRIAFLGSSTTFDAGSLSNSYPYLVTETLRKNNNPEIEFINASAHAYSLKDILINYQFRVSKFKPDLIVIYEGRNDLILSGLFQPTEDITSSTNIYANVNYPNSIHKTIARQSILYIVFCELFTKISFRENFFKSNSELLPKTLNEFITNVKASNYLISYQRDLETISLLTKMDSTKLLFVGFDADFSKLNSFMPIPKDRNFSKEEINYLEKKLDSSNLITKKICTKYDHLYFLNLHNKIPKKYFWDDCHLDSVGNHIKSYLIADYIQKNIKLVK